MPVSRFDQPISIRSTFVPREWMPNFDALDQALGQQQQGFDIAKAVSSKIPEHLKYDRPFIQEYKQELDDAMEGVANIYKSQGINAGNRARRDLIQQVQQDWQPGGRADIFQKRLATFKQEADNIREIYKDQPILQQYYLKRLETEGVQPYRTESGAYGDITTPQGMVRHVDAKEMSDWLNKAIDNIKDTDLKRMGISKIQLKNFQYLWQQGKIKGRKYKDIVQTLAQQLPPEFIASAQQYSDALGREIDETRIINEEGLPNVDTTLGRIIAGGARGRAREDLERQQGSFTDRAALTRYEAEYNKDKSFYEFPAPTTDIKYDPQKEQEQIKVSRQGLAAALKTIEDYHQMLASGKTATPEQTAAYEDAIRMKNDNQRALNLKVKNMNNILDQTGFDWDKALSGKFAKNKTPDINFLKNNLDRLIAGDLTIPGVPKHKLDALAKRVSNHLEKNQEDLTQHRNFTLVKATSDTQIAKRNKAMADAFLNGAIGLQGIDGKLLDDKRIADKLKNGQLSIIDVKEPYEGKPVFAIVSTPTTDDGVNFLGQEGKGIKYVQITGDPSMIIEQNKRNYREMYYEGDPVDQESAAWGYGYYSKAPGTSLSVGEQIESMDLERKPSGWEADVPIQTPVGDVYLRKYEDANTGKIFYSHDLFKPGTKERYVDHQTGEEIHTLSGDPYGVATDYNEIIRLIGDVQLRREAGQ